MKVTTTMMYEIAKIIGGDLEIWDTKATKVCPKRPLYISDIEKLFERFCPNADKVLELNDELKAANDKIKKLKEVRDVNIEHTIAAIEKRKELEKENKQLKDAYEVLVDEKKELEKKCNDYAESNNELGDIIAELIKKNERLSTFMSLKEERIEILKQRCEEVEEEKKKLQKEYERLGEQNVTLNIFNSMLHLNNKALETELAEANKKITHLTHTIGYMNNQIISLQATAEGLQKKLDKAYNDLRDKKDNVYEMEIRKIRKERDKYHNDFKSIKGTYEKTLKDFEKIKLVAKTYRDEREKSMSVRSELRQENYELRKKLRFIDSPIFYTQFTADSMARYSGDNTWIVYEGDYILGFIVVNPEFAKEVGLEFYFREHNYNEIKDALTTIMRTPAIGDLKTIFKEIHLTHDLSRESKI